MPALRRILLGLSLSSIIEDIPIIGDVIGTATGLSQTYVSATTIPLLEYNPDYLQNLVLQSILGKTSITELILHNKKQNLFTNVSAVLREIDEDRSLWRMLLPTQYDSDFTYVSDTAAADIVTEDLGLPYGCITLFSFMTYMTPFIAVVPYLLDSRGYNPLYDSISILPESWVFPTEYNGYSVIAPTKATVTNVRLLNDAIPSTIAITYSAELTYVNTLTDFPVIPTTEYTHEFTEYYTVPDTLLIDHKYYVVGYDELDVGGTPEGKTNWWYYSTNSDKYPTMSITRQEQAKTGYPILPIIYREKFVSPSYNSKFYNPSKLVLHRIGMSFADIQSSLEENEDITDIDYGYVVFGANLQSNYRETLLYLVNFFTELAKVDNENVWDALADSRNTSNSVGFSFTDIEPGETDSTGYQRVNPTSGDIITTTVVNPVDSLVIDRYGIDIAINYSYVTSVLTTETVGDVGTVTKSIDANKETLYLKHQVATNVCRVVTVKGLILTNTIKGYKTVKINISDVANNPDEQGFLIPLNRQIVSSTLPQEQSALYQQSLSLVLTSHERTTLDWYHANIVQFAIQAAPYLIAVATLQPWIGAAVAITAAFGAQALLLYIALSVCLVAGMQGGILLVGKFMKPEHAAILFLVTAAIVGANYAGIPIPGISMPPIEALIYLGSVFQQGAQVGIQYQLGDIQADYIEYMMNAENELRILEEQADLLLPDSLLPLDHIRRIEALKPDTITKPDRFYDKIHTGNIGTLSLNMVETYVDRLLVLPAAEHNTYK